MCYLFYPFAGTHGPRRWASAYPECGDRNQSPVDILDQDAQFSQECQELTLDGFETKSSNRTTMKNTGKTGPSKSKLMIFNNIKKIMLLA